MDQEGEGDGNDSAGRGPSAEFYKGYGNDSPEIGPFRQREPWKTCCRVNQAELDAERALYAELRAPRLSEM